MSIDRRIEKARREQLTTLDLSNNQLTAIPPEIAKLSKLRELDLGHNQLTAIPPEIAKLSKLTTLHLSNNQLTALPPEITKLSKLTTLTLSDNQLTAIPPEITKLSSLTTLDFSDNPLTALQPAIAKLSKLTTLQLSDNQLTAIPPEIAKLSNLTTLQLSGNQLTAIPTEIAKLSNLTTLYIWGNQLKAIPTEIAKLSKLTTLYLSNNQLTAIPTEIAKLSNLTTLSLEGNQLTTLPPEIAKLSNLTTLDLSHNQLTTISPEIAKLSNLTTLYLEGNQLAALPPEIQRLSELERLYLHDNEALQIPPEILGPLPLDFDQTPAHPAEILNYYFRRLREASRPLLEAKLLVVGQGAVGKTSLVNRLVHDTFDPEETKTEGIDIVRWQIPGEGSDAIRVNIWDFGGQEIMHATHQFFLTRRSLYLLVLDARKGENEGNLHYWLRIIRSFGGESPVLVVTNKHEAPNQLELNETRLAKDFDPNIRGFYRTSCQEGTGLRRLRRAIAHEVRRLDHVYDPVPQSFFSVKEQLESRTRTEDYLELGEYEKLCRDAGLDKSSDQKLLLRFLHDLGSVLHFSDPESPYPLEETTILNPEWVTRGVYKILNNLGLMKAAGVLELALLGRVLRTEEGYPKNRRLFIIGMMRKFELCFDFPEADGRLLVPELLSPNEPDLGWEEQEALRFEYHYAVLPDGLLPRFITRTHQHLTAKPTYWRSGVLLEIDRNKVLVRADTQAGRLFIAVSGPTPGRRRALTAVRVQLSAIHRTVPGLEATAMVPLPRDPGQVVKYSFLLRLEAQGRHDHLFEDAKEPYRVRELLDGIEEPEVRQDRHRQEIIMGDKYEIRGPTGAVGPHARSEGNTFQQLYVEAARDLDLQQLAKELAQLRETLHQEASTPDHYRALAAVSEAEEAAGQGEGSKVMERLEAAGQWCFEVATKIGTSVAAKAIQTSMGL